MAETIQGIDVSNYQGVIDWHQVASSENVFAFAKATEGIGFIDRYFARNWQAMAGADLVRGAYHFAQPGQSDPVHQAGLFLEQIDGSGGLQPGDLLALDLESGQGNLLPWVTGWLSEVLAATGVRPFLYSRASFLQESGCTNSTTLAEYGLWLADYSGLPIQPPPGWPVIAMQQYTASGRVSGITGPCDMNVFYGSLKQLLKYGKPSTLPVPDPTTTIEHLREELQKARELLDTARYGLAEDIKGWGQAVEDLDKLSNSSIGAATTNLAWFRRALLAHKDGAKALADKLR